MLTLTDDAVVAIRTLTESQAVSEDEGGLRITNEVGTLTLSVASGPAEGDRVVEDSGARLFLTPEAAQILDDKALHATMGTDGDIQFIVADSEDDADV